MFEKASEEYGKMISEGMQIKEGSFTSYALRSAILGFKNGAEFGYNKANEWHYVKNGGFPKDGETVLVCRDDMQIWTGNRHSKRENSYFWYIHNLHEVLYKDSDIYAWKEIVLPKEKVE